MKGYRIVKIVELLHKMKISVETRWQNPFGRTKT